MLIFCFRLIRRAVYIVKMPIIDYHCHLDPKMIARNYRFSDLTEVWLGGDHYKWRAMRANGIPEEYITGNKPSYEKFEKWAETLPYTMRNPLYHWTHLELNRIFGISDILKPSNARDIYEECTAKLQTPEFRPQAIMKRMRVETVGTTDDPVDTLNYHREIRESGFSVKVFPTWRPDKAMAVENPQIYNEYIAKLETASGMSINTYIDLLDALQRRHDYFEQEGCNLSDHGISTFYADPYTENEIRQIFLSVRSGHAPTLEEINKFRSAMLNALSAIGLLSRFVGMLTDSRSFLSYPRHEYFRRLLCNMIGNDIENGLLPVSEITFIGQMLEDICYYNAKRYFGW